MVGRHEALVSGEIYDENGDVCARSKGNFALLTPKLAVRMGIVNAATIKDIEKIINS